MLAVVEELDAAGYETVIAGGGPGAKFVEENGYSEYEPLAVDFIGDYQDGSLVEVLSNSAPAVYERVNQYRTWFAEEAPAILLTDDICAAIAAALSGQRYVYLSHDPTAFYTTTVERAGAWVRNRIALRTAEQFLLPKVWSGDPTIPGATEIPPIAPGPAGDEVDVDGDVDVDVLVVPSAFTIDPADLAAALDARGRDVTLVGGDDWEVQESLQPYIAGANLVICSGYSTVMECAVAGTPCIVLPATSEQRGVVDALADEPGFYTADSIQRIESLLDIVESPVAHENGAQTVAEIVSTYLPDPGDPAASGASAD